MKKQCDCRDAVKRIHRCWLTTCLILSLTSLSTGVVLLSCSNQLHLAFMQPGQLLLPGLVIIPHGQQLGIIMAKV